MPEARVRDGIARRTSFNLIHLETMLKADVLGVLRAGGASLDRGYLEDGARELAVADLLDRALAEAEGK